MNGKGCEERGHDLISASTPKFANQNLVKPKIFSQDCWSLGKCFNSTKGRG